uniref:Uncharacterized protein n=1 Tax=Coccolithus braarudii TaxID=221442 RepID=A0A7S0PWZ6_9EUKA
MLQGQRTLGVQPSVFAKSNQGRASAHRLIGEPSTGGTLEQQLVLDLAMNYILLLVVVVAADIGGGGGLGLLPLAPPLVAPPLLLPLGQPLRDVVVHRGPLCEWAPL